VAQPASPAALAASTAQRIRRAGHGRERRQPPPGFANGCPSKSPFSVIAPEFAWGLSPDDPMFRKNSYPIPGYRTAGSKNIPKIAGLSALCFEYIGRDDLERPFLTR
jgi:hypothetical protein